MYIVYSKPNSSVRVAVVGTYNEGVLTCAVARCSNKDNFSKKKGRELAEERLTKGNYYQRVQLDSCDAKQFVNIANGIIKQVETSPIVYNTEVHKKIRENYLRRKKQQLYSRINKLKKQLSTIDLSENKFEDSKIIDIFQMREPEQAMHARFANPEE